MKHYIKYQIEKNNMKGYTQELSGEEFEKLLNVPEGMRIVNIKPSPIGDYSFIVACVLKESV